MKRAADVLRALAPREERLRALLVAGTEIASELSLEVLLQRLVATAAELTGARYAALGVIDRTGQQLEQFITTGVDDETFDRKVDAIRSVANRIPY